MRLLTLAAALTAAFTAAAGETITHDGISFKREAPKVEKLNATEVERFLFADFRKNVQPPYPDWILAYWQKRMDVAAEVDSGRMSFEAYLSARASQDEMYNARLDSELAVLRRNAASQAAADRYSEAARRQQQSLEMLDLAGKLIARPPVAPAVNCITTRFGNTSTTNCR